MPDREHEDLERELRELAPRIKYPSTPDVSRTVRRKLDSETAERTGPRGWLRTLARPGWAAAAALTVLISLSVLSPAIRSTVSGSISPGASGGAGQAAGGASPAPSEYAGEEAAQPAQGEPSGAAGSSAAGYAMPPGTGLGLGDRLSTSEARARVGRLLLPSTPKLSTESENFCAEPRAVCAAGRSREDGVVLVFGPGPGLPPMGDTDVGILLAETPGDLDEAYPPGDRPAGARMEEVAVGGDRGYWIPDGRSLRSQPGKAESLPGGALLWEKEDTALLMRANVTREEAIRIAGTVR